MANKGAEVIANEAAQTVDSVKPYEAHAIDLAADVFLPVAQHVHDEFYLKLPGIYLPRAPREARAEFFAGCTRGAAQVTADVWATVFSMIGPKAIAALAA